MKSSDFERARHIIDGIKSVRLMREQGLSNVVFVTKATRGAGASQIGFAPNPKLERLWTEYLDGREAELKRLAAQISLTISE